VSRRHYINTQLRCEQETLFLITKVKTFFKRPGNKFLMVKDIVAIIYTAAKTMIISKQHTIINNQLNKSLPTFFSVRITRPSSWSSSPFIVTVKSIIAVLALTSGVYAGLPSFVVI